MADQVVALAAAVQDIRLMRVCQLAATFVALYDHALTIDQEVELIWKKRWSLAKILFAVRHAYLVIFFNESLSDQGYVIPPEAMIHLQRVFHVDHILHNPRLVTMQMRLYAMYEKSRRVFAFLLACFVSETIAMSTILGLSNKQLIAISQPIPGVRICTVAFVPHYFFAFWIPICTFESILVTFALWKGLSHWIKSTNKWSSKALMNVLLRDNILYFLVQVALSFISLHTLDDTSQHVSSIRHQHHCLACPSEIPEGFALATTCIMGSRLVLNIRKAYYLPYINTSGTLNMGATSPPIRFADEGEYLEAIQFGARLHGGYGARSGYGYRPDGSRISSICATPRTPNSRQSVSLSLPPRGTQVEIELVRVDETRV
ncbi:hypothetical protein JAAARDRAFT_211320 [Jaapia argillacea MUCL 33604]|uniref:DUF6533 domain-containing protein n=1 Tax=Jaapia argillacea MUCL 33604 TaxID=933084 RepID=A0A067P8D3_9AGAM|nr:hypothetical protein JAAARDRAFT_211320 [Jaapia argillacea MUCL 33604]